MVRCATECREEKPHGVGDNLLGSHTLAPTNPSRFLLRACAGNVFRGKLTS